MKKILLLIPAVLLLSACSIGGSSSSTTKSLQAEITTAKGKIVLTLNDKEAPQTVANFVKLVNEKFYDGLKFHRVVPNFVIQTGDPTGTGNGGSTDKVQLEILCADGKTVTGDVAPETCDPVLKHKRGAVGMARASNPNSATSQFYIALTDTPPATAEKDKLDRKYAVFGYVTEGIDIIDKISKDDVMTSVKMK